MTFNCSINSSMLPIWLHVNSWNKSKAAGVGTQMYCSFQWSGERYQNLVSNVRAAGNGEGLFIGVKKRALNMDVSLEEREMKRWWAFASKHWLDWHWRALHFQNNLQPFQYTSTIQWVSALVKELIIPFLNSQMSSLSCTSCFTSKNGYAISSTL